MLTPPSKMDETRSWKSWKMRLPSSSSEPLDGCRRTVSIVEVWDIGGGDGQTELERLELPPNDIFAKTLRNGYGPRIGRRLARLGARAGWQGSRQGVGPSRRKVLQCAFPRPCQVPSSPALLIDRPSAHFRKATGKASLPASLPTSKPVSTKASPSLLRSRAN